MVNRRGRHLVEPFYGFASFNRNCSSTKMAAQPLIPPPSKMDMKGDLVNNWQYFKSSWSNYEIATELYKKEKNIRVATLLSVMGKECFQVYENLPLTASQRADPASILLKLGEHFEPQRNTIYERYVFNSAVQEANENIEQYVNRLRKLASTCQYGGLLDELLRDRIVVGIKDQHTRARLLRESDLTLQKALDVCRSSELASLHLQKMEPTETVHSMMSKRRSKKPAQTAKDLNCSYCGNKHDKGKCPAYGHTCEYCHRNHHFEAVCLSKKKDSARAKNPAKGGKKSQKLHAVTEDDLSSDESIYTLTHADKTQYFVELHTKTTSSESSGERGTTLKFQIDSGATCSTLRMKDYQKLTSEPLQPSSANLKLYDQTVIQPVGAATLRCTAQNGIRKRVHFEVLEDAPVSLLS